MKTEKSMAGIGALLLMLSVIAGAFGAHMLEDKLDDHTLETYQKAVHYLTVHSLALIITTLLPVSFSVKRLTGLFFLVGIALFSGSLFVYSLSFLSSANGWKIFAMITPFGGMSFIFGWGFLSYNLIKR